MKKNYRFNQNNQHPYRAGPSTHQNSSSNRRVDAVQNNSPKPQFGKDGQHRPIDNQRRKKKFKAKIARQKKMADLLMAIVPVDFPPKTMSNIELEKVQDAVLEEIEKIVPGGFRPQFLTSFNRRGMFMISCNNPESVDWLKTTIETLKPWEEAQLKVVDSKDLPVYMNILITIPNSSGEPENILKRLEHQNEGLQTNTWYMMHHKVEENSVQTLKISVEENVIETLERLDFKVFLNLSKVEINVLGPTPDGIKPVKDEDQSVKAKDKAAMGTDSSTYKRD